MVAGSKRSRLSESDKTTNAEEGEEGKTQEVLALTWGIYRVFAVRIW